MKNNKTFIILAGFLLFLLCAFRQIDAGPDTIGYVANYNDLQNTDLSAVWLNFVKSIGRDPFFNLFTKIISLLRVSSQVWLAIMSAIFCFSALNLIYKYSEEAYLSVTMLISLGFLYFSFTGLRQAIALSITMLSYRYIRERKFVPFIAMVLLASLFHESAIVFLLAYPFATMKIGWKQIVGVIIAQILAYNYSKQLLMILETLHLDTRYSNYIERDIVLTSSGFIIQICIYLYCIYHKNKVLKSDEKSLTLYNIIFLGVIFQSFAIVIAEAFRISMYFSIFSILLVPKALYTENNERTRKLKYFVIIVILIIYISISKYYDDFKLAL